MHCPTVKPRATVLTLGKLMGKKNNIKKNEISCTTEAYGSLHDRKEKKQNQTLHLSPPNQ